MFTPSLRLITRLAAPASRRLPHPRLPSPRLDAKKAELVIFDKDGTLVCFHSLWVPWAEQTVQRLEEESGLALAEKVNQLLGFCPLEGRVFSGLLAEGTMAQIREAIEGLLQKEGLQPLEAKRIVMRAVRDCNADSEFCVKETHDLHSLFTELKRHHVKIAVCTSDSRLGTEHALAALNIAHFIDCIVCGDDANGRPKPAAHNALSICQKLDVSPQDALVVGDTLADLGMGRRARLRASIGVLSGVGQGPELFPFADYLLKDVGELLPIVVGQDANGVASSF